MKKHLATLALLLCFVGGYNAFANTTLIQGITENGVLQGDLVKYLGNVRDLVNEVQTKFATTKTTVDALRTAVLELKSDHDTDNAAVITDLKALVNQLRTTALYICRDNPGFAISSNFDVKNATAVYYTNGGTLKTLSANTNFDTGTAKTIAGSQWAAGLLTVNSSGTGVVTWTADAASEAAAIALLAAPAATDTVMGYVTVNAHASGFIAGTSALTTGTGGNVATATNYYNNMNPNSAVVSAAVSTSPQAALSAADPAAGPASLTNSTALTLNPN